MDYTFFFAINKPREIILKLGIFSVPLVGELICFGVTLVSCQLMLLKGIRVGN